MRRKPLIIIACLGLFIVSAIFIWSAIRTSKPPFVSAAAPAYDTLVLATQRLLNGDPSPATNELAAYLATNAPALQKLREALNQKFEAPEKAYDNPAALGAGQYEIGSFKGLALILKNEGRFYENQSKPLEAAHSYADIIRFGTMVEAGPFLFAMIGVGVERIGVEALQELEPKLQGPSRKEIASKLREINSERVPFPTIVDRERYIRRRHSPTPLHYLIFSRQVRASAARTRDKYETAYQAVDALANKLETR
jgi:hypothetical protein